MKVRWIWGVLGGVLVSLGTLSGLRADPLDRWTWLYPRPQGATLRAVTYGSGLFVAVGDYGTVVTSSNGFAWTIQTYGKCPALNGVSHANGVFVAVGDSGATLSSTNGVHWVSRVSGTTSRLRSVAGNPSFLSDQTAQFLAVGDAGIAIMCTNASNWTNCITGTTNNLNAVALVDGFFAALGDRGTLLLTDGSFWFPGNSGTTNSLNAFVIGNGIYAAGGDLGTYTPPNGITTNAVLYSTDIFTNWKKQLFSGTWGGTPGLWFPSDLFILNGMAFGNDRFAAVGDTGHTLEFTYPGVIMISDTGTNWTETSPFTSENRLYGVTFGNGLFVAVGDAGAILASTNGVNWAEITTYHRTSIISIACTEKLCIASGRPMTHFYWPFSDFTTLVSSNGVDWNISTTNLPQMTDLLGSGNLFVGVNGVCVYTTTDGVNWANSCVSSTTLRGVGFGKEQFVVVGDSGSIYTSSDGLSWSNRSVATTGSFNCATYGNGLYVAGGTVVATSEDGVSWTLFPTNPPAFLARIVYANRIFAAAGNVGPYYAPDGKLLSSSDGRNWTIRISTAGSATGIAYANGTFLAISSAHGFYRSSDGVDWLPTQAALPQIDGGSFRIYYDYPYSFAPPVCARQGRFLAAGIDGVLMQSGDTRVPILSGSARLTDLGFTFTFNPQIGEPYRIQTSTDLEFWENATGGVASEQPSTFTDSTLTASPKRFFRVVSP